MSILSELGLDPETLKWEDLGACRNWPKTKDMLDVFFDRYEEDDAIAQATDSLCQGCPVIKQCYAYGVKNELVGVWGGVYLTDGEIDGKINRHKTDEDWNVWTNLTKQ